MIRGALAAAVTPLRDGGRALDEEAVAPLLRFLAGAGLDGVLAAGTTGEGVLLSLAERRRLAELFLAAAGPLDVAVHCGAQTTADTVALCAHAAELGAAAVAVIGPPYYALDEQELLEHFAAAAAAAAPVPFYVYEFQARSGYAVPPALLERLRERAPNLAGLKVSDAPFERFRAYLLEGFDVFVGPESLISAGMAGGAVGAVSGLASAFPELVAAAVREPAGEAAARVGRVRALVQGLPFQAALKAVLRERGVPISADVRRPLRGLSAAELERLRALLAEIEGAGVGV